MEVGWSARQIARQSGLSDCVVRRCWDQWIREMSFTQRPVSGRTRQTIRREDHHIARNARACVSIGFHPGAGSIFTKDLCVFSNHTKAPG
ncbi:uncharacterized protein TNCV_715061 [Trichonephila clavipes]|nr:uncharacterized protein TNCV_715061 [Trichonephila clavipes]